MIGVVVLGVLGVVFALLLFIVAKFFSVEQDERVIRVLELLPGANCGGCGFAGCSDFAKALVEGRANPSQCPVSSQETKEMISSLLGLILDTSEKRVAVVRCGGDGAVAKWVGRFVGDKRCLDVQVSTGGDKGCVWGCLGYGDCVKVCSFGAIEIRDGIAYVDRDKCVGCGKCVEVCPRGIIELVPEKNKVSVLCMSHQFGKAVLDWCKKGCIGCGRCVKECPVGAISLDDKLARIDYSKCINCGKCVSVCPTGAIVDFRKR